jgi:drug/metabolite transporter (DMT)-like permease
MSQADPIVWGLASMFAWGVSDMLARYASIRLGSPAVAMIVQGLGIAPPLILGISRYPTWGALAQGDFIALVLSASLLFSLAYVIYYRGLERGLVSIVSPLTSGWLVVTTVLAAIFFHEDVGLLKWLLIVVVVLGIVLTSTKGRDGPSMSGVWYGLATMVTMGMAFTLWKPLVDDVGPYIAVASVRVLSTVMLGLYLAARKSPRPPMSSGAAALVIGAAVLDSLGFVTFNLGIERAAVSLIAPIAASYPAVTLALAWFLLRERVSRAQMAGIVVVLGGVIAFSAAG